ncbi:MAG: hypothetical protein Q7J57_11210, partial [Gemmobacter sp.]|nr:hypothetical protein [Gemmobacter sp.]
METFGNQLCPKGDSPSKFSQGVFRATIVARFIPAQRRIVTDIGENGVRMQGIRQDRLGIISESATKATGDSPYGCIIASVFSDIRGMDRQRLGSFYFPARIIRRKRVLPCRRRKGGPWGRSFEWCCAARRKSFGVQAALCETVLIASGQLLSLAYQASASLRTSGRPVNKRRAVFGTHHVLLSIRTVDTDFRLASSLRRAAEKRERIMPVLALYDFNDTDTTARDSALGNGAQDGIYLQGASASGGRLQLDGVNDIAKIYKSDEFQMDRGTLEIQFSQTSHVGSGPNTVLSRDSLNLGDGGGYRVEVYLDGSI